MRKYQEEKNKYKNRKREILLRILFLLVFVLLGTQIILSNAISSSGDRLLMLDQKHQQLLSQNEQISKQISYLTSLTTLENRAKYLGFMNIIPSLIICHKKASAIWPRSCIICSSEVTAHTSGHLRPFLRRHSLRRG